MCHTCSNSPARAEERALTKSVFRRAAYPTWVITSAANFEPVGFTATSVVSVSMEPPLISFNLAKTSSALPVLRHTRWAAVHLLDAQQETVAARFAGPVDERFADSGSWTFDERGLPELADTCARLVLSVRELFDAGDSYVVLADVEEGAVTSAIPLLHHRGAFTPGDRLIQHQS